MVGLHSGTHSKIVVIGGILTIAVADAFSDALGIHMSEESENRHSSKEVWEATIMTFIAKFFFALTFLLPVLLLPLSAAIAVSLVWGLSLIGIFSYSMGKEQKANPWQVMGEHLLIAVVVVVITHLIGDWVAMLGK
jgi:VIT1/CCC1 family predicted Fe2+/Mn2+ transporter